MYTCCNCYKFGRENVLQKPTISCFIVAWTGRSADPNEVGSQLCCVYAVQNYKSWCSRVWRLSVSRHSRADDSINLKMTAVQHAAASGVRLHNRAHVQPVAVSLLNPKHGFLSLSLFIKWKITLNYVDLGNFQDSLSNFMYDSLIDCSEGHIWKQTYLCVNK